MSLCVLLFLIIKKNKTMKKNLYILCIGAAILIWGNAFSQDTIVAWTFPAHSADEYPDASISVNASRFLSCEYGTYGQPTYVELAIDYSADGYGGAPDKCAQTTGWNDSADSTAWMVKFRTPGYENLFLYSKQRSTSAAPGPRDFKVQYKLSGSTSPWIDIPNGIVTCTDDWSVGFLNGISLPAECNDQSSNVSLRWISTSNTNIEGNPTDASGVSQIDDIIIIGSLITGIEKTGQSAPIIVYPNPNKGSFVVDNISSAKHVKITSSDGKVIIEKPLHLDNSISIDGLSKGVYFVNLSYDGGSNKTLSIIVY